MAVYACKALIAWWYCSGKSVRCVSLKSSYNSNSDREDEVIPAEGRWGRGRPRIDRQELVDAPLVAAKKGGGDLREFIKI